MTKDANEIYGNQAEYQKALIESAVGIAKSRKPLAPLAFDPQGRILIELSLEPEALKNLFKIEPAQDSDPAEQLEALLGRNPATKTLCSIDIRDTELEEDFLNSLGEEFRPKLEALFNSASRGSVISLQEEVMMHGFLMLNLIRKAFKKAGEGLAESELANIKEKLHVQVNKEVNAVFKKALKKAYNEKTRSIDIKQLNKMLDKARKQISLSAEKFLAGEFKKSSNNLASMIKHITKHLAESSTATDNDFLHTDADAGLTTFIEHSSNTSHKRGKDGKTLALRQIQHHHYSSKDKVIRVTKLTHFRVQVRVPSIALKEGNIEGAVEDVAAKLAFIKGQYKTQSPDSKALVYNLLTALNGYSPIDRYDESNNQQRESADRILRGAHLANMREINSTDPLYCFVQNISVNGFGQSLGYSWYKRGTTKEATLMTEIALLYTLKGVNKSIAPVYDEVIQCYNNFLNEMKDGKAAVYFSASKEGRKAIVTIKNLKKQLKASSGTESVSHDKEKLAKRPEEDIVDIHTLAQKALQNLFSQNKHFDHKYAKLVQTLSILCEKFSISGCKSANERAQAVFGRVSALLRLEENKRSELAKTEKDLIAAFESQSFDSRQLNKTLDIYYNECGLQGGPSKISLLDQGGPSKLQSVSQAGWMPHTNYGESAELSYLCQTKASKMQAHKGLAERLRNFMAGSAPLSRLQKTLYGALSLIGLGSLVAKAKVTISTESKNVEDEHYSSEQKNKKTAMALAGEAHERVASIQPEKKSIDLSKENRVTTSHSTIFARGNHSPESPGDDAESVSSDKGKGIRPTMHR